MSQSVYDFLGRRIAAKSGVNDENHNIGGGKPTMTTLTEMFYDDPGSDAVPEQGAGDGNVSWVRGWYDAGASEYNDTEHRYDWRHRRGLTIPPVKPYTLVKFDNLNHVTAVGS